MNNEKKALEAQGKGCNVVLPSSSLPFNNDKREKKKSITTAMPETGSVNKKAKCRMTTASDIAPEGVTHDSHYTLAEVMSKFNIKYGRLYEIRNRYQLASIHASEPLPKLTVITFPDIGAVIPTLNQGICSTHLPLLSAEQAIAFGEHRGCLFRRHPYFFDPLIVFLYCFHQFSVAFLIKVTALHFIVGRVMRQQFIRQTGIAPHNEGLPRLAIHADKIGLARCEYQFCPQHSDYSCVR